MYSIGSIVWGIPINEPLRDVIEGELETAEEWPLDEHDHILSWYNGGDDTPPCFGIEIEGIDVCQNIKLETLMENVNLQLPEAQIKLNKNWETLNPIIKKHLKLEDADLWLIWSTS